MEYVMLVILIAIAVEVGVKNQKKRSASVRISGAANREAKNASAAAETAAETAAEKAKNAPKDARPAVTAFRAEPPLVRTFESLEGNAEETRWHDAVMGEEGSDPCHDGMYEELHTDAIAKHDEHTAATREWARAVVMAEILKRPSERRRSACGGK